MWLLILVLQICGIVSDCPDIETTDEFKEILHGKLKKQCDSTADSECVVSCSSGYKMYNEKQQMKATCDCSSDCKWSYGSHGGWRGAEDDHRPNFGCCEKPTRPFGNVFRKTFTSGMVGRKYFEADHHQAIVGYKIKIRESAPNGHSIFLQLPNVLPDDVKISTFVRYKIVSLFRDVQNSKTMIMLNSEGAIQAGDKFYIMLQLRGGGPTNVKEYVTNTNLKIHYYAEQHSCWCPGNEDFCDHKSPTGATFSSFNIQVFGKTKYGKDIVKDHIVKILKRYDVSTIQEIRDSSETYFPKLVADLNADADVYDSIAGIRQGSTSSKEQVGFIWNRNIFELEIYMSAMSTKRNKNGNLQL
jgi:hypothetical protein